jgi:hypothetical protein
MRVSSLSHPRIRELISTYFVPVLVSRDDYQRDPRSEDEKAELLRIDHECTRRGLKGGSVCVFLIAANGDVLATQQLHQACKPEKLLPFLQQIIAEQKLTPRRAEAIRASIAEPTDSQPSRDRKETENNFIDIWTRLDVDGNRLSHDRVKLTAAQCKAFLPPIDAQPGTSWDIPEEIAHKLFQYGYPPGPQWRAKDCKVLKGTLKATLAAVSNEEARIRLEGELRLKFPVGKPTEGRLTAHFVGLACEDRKKQMLTSLMLVSEQANYVWYWQGKPQPRKMQIALELEPLSRTADPISPSPARHLPSGSR